MPAGPAVGSAIAAAGFAPDSEVRPKVTSDVISTIDAIPPSIATARSSRPRTCASSQGRHPPRGAVRRPSGSDATCPLRLLDIHAFEALGDEVRLHALHLG